MGIFVTMEGQRKTHLRMLEVSHTQAPGKLSAICGNLVSEIWLLGFICCVLGDVGQGCATFCCILLLDIFLGLVGG